MQTFGGRLRAARNAVGITQERLGDLVGVSKASVSRWESDDDQPAVALLPKLRDALRVSLDSLVCGDQPYVLAKAVPLVVREPQPGAAAAPDAAATEVALQSILTALIENVPASAGSFVESAAALGQGRTLADGKTPLLEDPALGSLLYIAQQAVKRLESVGRRDLLRDAAPKPK